MASADVKMLNLAKVLARLERLPEAMTKAAGDQLKVEVDTLVGVMKRVAPNDPKTGGNRIAEHIRAYPNPNRPLSYRIISDAKDEDGKPIAANVEHGHRVVAKGGVATGEHVPARPTFFPAYRLSKAKLHRRILSKSRAALRQLYPR